MPRTCLLGGRERGLRLLGLRDGGLGGGLLGDQRVPRLVELLGDDLELVAAGGDELGGLGRGGRVPGAAWAGTAANRMPTTATSARPARRADVRSAGGMRVAMVRRLSVLVHGRLPG